MPGENASETWFVCVWCGWAGLLCWNKSTLPFTRLRKIRKNSHSPPWRCFCPYANRQNEPQRHVTGSGFLISKHRILTNAHVVSDQKFVTVTKHQSSQHFPAEVVAVGHECDLAMLSVADESFWEAVDPLEFGETPQLNDSVVVVGYPIGGKTVCVTKGMCRYVKRINQHSHTYHFFTAINIHQSFHQQSHPQTGHGTVLLFDFLLRLTYTFCSSFFYKLSQSPWSIDKGVPVQGVLFTAFRWVCTFDCFMRVLCVYDIKLCDLH